MILGGKVGILGGFLPVLAGTCSLGGKMGIFCVVYSFSVVGDFEILVVFHPGLGICLPSLEYFLLDLFMFVHCVRAFVPFPSDLLGGAAFLGSWRGLFASAHLFPSSFPPAVGSGCTKNPSRFTVFFLFVCWAI